MYVRGRSTAIATTVSDADFSLRARTQPLDGSRCLGGLLADDMGLGKSLTVLSAVASSIPEALEFQVERGGSFEPRARGTLIIAPSRSMIEVFNTGAQIGG